jgi:hypothetical protein
MNQPDPPAPASDQAEESGIPSEEEPTTTGTLFIMILFLMALAGMWFLMYFVLLGR